MRESFQIIVSDFQTRLEAVRRQLVLVEYLVGLTSLPGDLRISKTQQKNIRRMSKGFSEYVSPVMRTSTSSAAIIISAALFEETIRKLIQESVSIVEKKKRNFSELGANLQLAQLQAFINRLKEIREPGELFKVEMQAQLQNMYNCATKDEAYVLDALGISKNERNMRSGEISDLCSRIGLKKLWSKIATLQEVQDFFGQYNLKVVEAELTNRLNSFIRVRNEIIHLQPLTSYGRPWIEAETNFLKLIANSAANELDRFVPV
jgi:hypothetical protein